MAFSPLCWFAPGKSARHGGANQLGGKRARGKQARGRTSKGVKKPDTVSSVQCVLLLLLRVLMEDIDGSGDLGPVFQCTFDGRSS